MNTALQDIGLAKAGKESALLEVPLVLAEGDSASSGECTLQIINDLQRYYQQRNFSHKERFGAPDPLSEAVLRDLSNAYDSAILWLNWAQGGNTPTRLESSISLKLVAE